MILDAYKRGYDCGLKGPNTTNCNFGLAWERGKRDGEKKKAALNTKIGDETQQIKGEK